MTNDSLSEVDKAEAGGIAAELQRAFKLGYPQDYKDLLTKNYDRLTGLDPFSYGVDERKAKAEQANNIAAAAAMQDHERFVSQGFNNKQDFFTFGKNLENDEYWNWLQDNPEEKKKVGEKAVDGLRQMLKDGKRKEVEEIIRNADPRLKEVLEVGGLDALSNEYGINKSAAVQELRKTTENMAGREKVEALVQDNLAKAASVAKGDEDGAKEATDNRNESGFKVRDAVIAKADELGIDSKYAKGSDNELAAYFEMPDAKAAANNLKESQNLVADTNKPVSSPTEVQIAQNDTGKSGGLSA